ncbi:MAG: PAS domain S-box protein [Spirochaetes bacterium]|nr:PAS domain S-box protein [Spirochaetota bacterium]
MTNATLLWMIAFSGMVTFALLSLSVVDQRRSGYSSDCGDMLWSLGILTIALGFAALATQGKTPAWIGIVAADGFLVGGQILYALGMRHFIGRPPRIAVHVAFFGLVMAAVVYFTFFRPSPSARNVLVPLAAAFLFIETGWSCMSIRSGLPGMIPAVVAFVFFASGAAHAARAFIGVLAPIESILSYDPVNTATYMGWSFSMIGCSLGLVLLWNLRLRTAAHRNADRFRCYFDIPLVGIGITAPDHRWIEANGRLCKILGYDLQELSLTTLPGLVHPGDRDACLACYRSALEGKAAATEIRFIRKDGETIWASVAVRAEHNADGSVSYLASAVQDVTERIRTENRLRESHENIMALMETSLDAVLIVDPDGVILESNRKFASRYGLSPKEIAGTSYWSWLPPEVAECREKRIAKIFASRVPATFEDASGERVMDITAYPVTDGTGEVSRLVVMARDINDRKLAGKALENACEENGMLLRELQHRVKNSLAVIAGLISLESGRQKDANTRQTLNDLGNRISTLASLYDLMYRSGEIRSISLDEYLGEIADGLMTSSGADERGIHLRHELAPLRLDAKRAIPLGLIVNELITDALKHAFPDGRSGSITLTLRNVDHRAILEIGDDGVGLSPGFTLEAAEGFGLRLVDALSGQIQGSFEFAVAPSIRFRISLPLEA